MTLVKIDRLGSKGDGIGIVGDANVFANFNVGSMHPMLNGSALSWLTL